MNQQDLADAVAKAIGVDKAEAAKAVAAVLDTIRDSLKRGEKIAIGSFETVHREARPGRNPKTGEVVEIPAGIVIKFKPVKGLKDAVNGSRQE
jgi:DNA-binding protein HU-beta